MFNLLAHAGHAHNMESMTVWDHCAPIVWGAALIIAFLLAVIIYMLVTWQSKSFPASKKSSSTKKKTSKK